MGLPAGAAALLFALLFALLAEGCSIQRWRPGGGTPGNTVCCHVQGFMFKPPLPTCRGEASQVVKQICSAQRPKSIAGISKDSIQHITWLSLWSSAYTMPALRGLLWLPVLRAGSLHTETVVLLVPADDGCSLLLWSRLLYPEAHVPPAADGGACIQRVLYQAAPKPCSRSPACGAAVLYRPWRTGCESCWEPNGHGVPGPAKFTTGQHGLPATPLLLQHPPTPV
ncbi:WW domain binding protein VOPP1 isoform X1 [Erinaceus europaeus]|uniref:WW domain binding protein VOPP1 isoform X1 n=1 Tax=Erinaceus europaeus TaxID=9365 RepID=A0ABM3VT55_ERIEU|nr:WW domain binding protein VOPP1 isoform X1 [Erinaceus europaeus]